MIGQNKVRVNLEAEPGAVVEVTINGILISETTVGVTDGRDELMEEVRSARALHALPLILRGTLDELARAERLPDHVNPAAKRQGRFLAGLLDGYAGKTVPYPMPIPGVPPILPAYDPSYERGYRHGDALRRASDIGTQPAREEAQC